VSEPEPLEFVEIPIPTLQTGKPVHVVELLVEEGALVEAGANRAGQTVPVAVLECEKVEYAWRLKLTGLIAWRVAAGDVLMPGAPFCRIYPVE